MNASRLTAWIVDARARSVGRLARGMPNAILDWHAFQELIFHTRHSVINLRNLESPVILLRSASMKPCVGIQAGIVSIKIEGRDACSNTHYLLMLLLDGLQSIMTC